VARSLVVRMFVHDQQLVDLRRVVVFELINFLLRDRPTLAELQIGRMPLGLVQAIDANLGAVRLELPAQHFDISGPAVKSVAGRMHADECFAGTEPFEKTIPIGNRQITSGVGEDDPIKTFQRFGLSFERASFIF